MSRIARLVVPGYPHHVTQRGARKQQTFFSKFDYKFYRQLLSRARKTAGVDIWAYCLMPNHVHLIVVPQSVNSLANLFRVAHRTYAVAINAREGWQGHLWQERYRSFVMGEEHLLAAARYVELNPVRAGLCRRPGEWPWSSYSAHLNGKDDDLVVVRPMLDRVGNWQQFICTDENDGEVFSAFRERSRTGRPLGGDAFIDRLEEMTGRYLHSRKPGRPKKGTE